MCGFRRDNVIICPDDRGLQEAAPQPPGENPAPLSASKRQRILAALVDRPTGLLELVGQHDPVALEFREGGALPSGHEPGREA